VVFDGSLMILNKKQKSRCFSLIIDNLLCSQERQLGIFHASNLPISLIVIIGRFMVTRINRIKKPHCFAVVGSDPPFPCAPVLASTYRQGHTEGKMIKTKGREVVINAEGCGKEVEPVPTTTKKFLLLGRMEGHIFWLSSAVRVPHVRCCSLCVVC
jgi:hypothetical protein